MNRANVNIRLEGERPTSPQEMVLAMYAFARELAADPAEGTMLLLTAAVRIGRLHSKFDAAGQHKGLVETLPWAEKAHDGFWPPDALPCNEDGETLQ